MKSLVTSALQIRSLVTKFYKDGGLSVEPFIETLWHYFQLVYQSSFLPQHEKKGLTQILLKFNLADLEIWENFVE